MKHAFTTGLLMMVTTLVWSQQKNAASSTYHRNDTSKVLDVREKLVKLAMQNPNYEVADRTVNKSIYELRKAKGSWLGAASVTGNLNEFSIKSNTGGVASFYPRYNLSLNLPFDIFTTKSNEIKIARENYLIAEANRNDKYREIRAVVLTMFEDYLMHKERLESQIRITQDEYLIFMSKERDFQDGIINQEEYTKFSKAYEETKLRRGEYQRNFNVAKYELERMIGIPLEEALATK
jgi:outer membrane protein TolC